MYNHLRNYYNCEVVELISYLGISNTRSLNLFSFIRISLNLLGFIVFVPVTMIMARIGAKAVYKIDKKLLSKIFGTFLIIVAVRSFIEYLSIN